jgi:Mrp family chromosome partitioning ATPase
VTGAVLAVAGGSGGVGASTFAAVLAATARAAVLIDLDPVSGGIDVLLGVEGRPGARWSGLRLDGGRLDPQLLADGLPRWHGVAVLAADQPAPSPTAVHQVVASAAELGLVVLDLPRATSPERAAGLAQCRLVIVVAAADVAGIAAGRAVALSLGSVALGFVLRRGAIPVAEAAQRAGGALLGQLPSLDRARSADSRRSWRAERRVAAGILDGLGAVGPARARR